MKRLLFLLLAVLPLAAAEPTLSEQLRDALYIEEVERDPAKAAESYEKILADFDKQRPLAASALFRLAEVRRKQEKNDEAIVLYQRLLREFPEFERESELAREHLATLGGEIPEAGEASPENAEIARLKQLAETAPDVFRDRDTLLKAASEGKLASVRFLLENGSDPNARYLLPGVASSGFLDIAKEFFAHGYKPNESEASAALTEAIVMNRISMLSYLLEQGLAPNSMSLDGESPYSLPILAAIERNEWEAAELLIKHGLDVNRIISLPDKNPSTLLQLYTKTGNLDAVRFLLKHNADPNLSAPDSEITPLVTAAESNSTEIIKLLLEKGANPKQPRALFHLLNADADGARGVRMLLEAGCDPNDSGYPDYPPIARVFDWKLNEIGNANEKSALHQKQVELIKLMLAHGADPNATSGGYSRNAANPRNRSSNDLTDRSPFLPAERTREEIPESLLLKVVALSEQQGMNNVHLLDALLDAGAKPGAGIPEIFTFVARSSEDIAPELAKKLLPYLPKELHTDVDEIFFRWHPGVRRLFLDEVLNPELTSRGGIQAVRTDSGSSRELLAAGKAIPETHQLLLELPHLDWLSQACRGDVLPTLTIVRRDEAGTWSQTKVDLASNDALPSLQEGDLIELTPDNQAGKESSFSRNNTQNNTLWWHLYRRIVVPIIVETDGLARPMTLRGDCLLYDPTSDIAPLLSSDRLGPLLWNIGYVVPNTDMAPRIIVTRKDWGEIPIDWNAREFKFEPGDKLRLEYPEELDAIRRSTRRNGIQLVVPGTSFAQIYFFDPQEVRNFAANPSLAALLAEAWLPVFPHPSEGSPQLAELASLTRNGAFPTSPPHPDFSKIRIRRLSDDQQEEIIEIDLTKAIDACRDETPNEIARQSDVHLQPGDIVELSLSESDEPYRGFSPEQNRYFKKVLSGSLQVFPREGAPFLAKIDWQPLEWIDTAAGTLPFAPEKGTSGTRPVDSPGSKQLLEAIGNPQTLMVERDGSKSNSSVASRVFLRDRDRVFSLDQAPQMRQPRPRSRVLLPPSR